VLREKEPKFFVFFNFSKTTQSKQSPIGRIFAQNSSNLVTLSTAKQARVEAIIQLHNTDNDARAARSAWHLIWKGIKVSQLLSSCLAVDRIVGLFRGSFFCKNFFFH
jgi:hypothetical protein